MALAACSREPDRVALGSTTQALTHLTLRFPAGTELGSVCLLASGALRVDDRSTIVDPDNRPAAIATTGSAGTTVGCDASSGSVVSKGSIALRDRARVIGDATSAGTITVGNGGSVTGTRRPNASVEPYGEQTLDVSFDSPPIGPVQLEPPNTGERVTTLSPGHYTTVNIKSRNRVNLTAGSYQFNSLDLEPQSRFVIDDSTGPVLIDVRDTLLFKGSVESTSGAHPALRLVYVGSNSPAIESAFAGTLIAPNASVRLPTPPNGAPHVGSFIARDLEVSPGTKVVFRPYYRLEVTPRFSVPSSQLGDLATAMDTPDGNALVATAQSVYRRAADGTLAALASEAHMRPHFDRSTGQWAYHRDGKFRHFDASGSLLAEYDTSGTIRGQLIPSRTESALFTAVDGSTDDSLVLTGIRLMGPGTQAQLSLPANVVVTGVSGDSIAYSDGSALVRLNRSGAVQWTVPTVLKALVLSDDGATAIGVRGIVGSTITHIDMATGSSMGADEVLSAPMREMHFSPDARYSLAETRTGAVVFLRGALVRRHSLALTSLTSSDVLNGGDIVAAGTDSTGVAISCEGPVGTGRWVSRLQPDTRAYRPWVAASRYSDGFYAISKEGLYSYRVTRRF
jgi:hypothetical protein